MDIFLPSFISALFFLLIVGAIVKAYILLPKRMHEMEKRIRELENKEDK